MLNALWSCFEVHEHFLPKFNVGKLSLTISSNKTAFFSTKTVRLNNVKLDFKVLLLDKFPYGAGFESVKDPFAHLTSPPPFGPPPISMAAMAAMAAASMVGGKAANGQSLPDESLAFEMLRKSKGFFPPQHGRPAFPGQPAQLPDVVSTLPAFSHRPDQPKLSPLLAAAAGVEPPHLRHDKVYKTFWS